MNTYLLQRFTYLAVLPLCLLLVLGTARGAEPSAVPVQSAAAETPASAAAVSDESSDHKDWHAETGTDAHHARRKHQSQNNDLVNVGHDSILSSGQRADSVVSVFGSSTSDGEAGEVVSVLGDTRVTGPVSDSAVAVMGNLYVDSKVEGDAVSVFGDLELGPHAEIEGDVVAVGGTLHRDPAAIVHGNVHGVFSGNFGNPTWLRTWVHDCLFYGRPLAFEPGLDWAWGLAFGFLALYVFLALLFREGLFRCVETVESRPGQTALAALITMLATPVLVVLLCVTVIGIAAVPFVVVGLFCAGLFGKAVMLAWLGRRVTGRHSAGALSHPAVCVLIGGAIVLVLYAIPVLGFIVYKLLGFFGMGAVVYTAIGAVRAHQLAKQVGPAPTLSAAAPSAGTTAQPQAAASPQAAAAAQSTAAPPASPAAQASPAVTAALPRAGFWIRMAALLLDGLLVGFVLSVVHHSTHFELLVLAVYGAVMWKMRGSTVGGIVFDLQVVRLDGREMDWETSIVRALGCFLSLAVAGLGFIWIAFDANRQGWHDKIAGTVVVRVAKAPPLV